MSILPTEESLMRYEKIIKSGKIQRTKKKILYCLARGTLKQWELKTENQSIQKGKNRRSYG